MSEPHRFLSGGPMFTRRDLLGIILPLAIEQTFISLMGMADTLMVSHLGEASISAVSCIDSVNTLVIQILEALALGGNVLCAQYIGRQDRDSVRDLVMQFMVFVFLLSLCITLPFLLLTGPCVTLFFPRMTPAIYTPSVVYTRITALSYPFVAVYTASAALYRAVGNTKLPVTVMTIGNLLNVAGNALFIYVFRWGVSGAAWATTLSRMFCCAVLLRRQLLPGQVISVTGLRGFRFRPDLLGSVFRVALPTMIENGMFQFGKILVQSLVVSLGASMAAAQAIIVQVEGLASRPAAGIALSLLTITGQCMGAERPDLAKQYTKRLARYAYLCCLVTGVLSVILLPALFQFADLSLEAERTITQINLFVAVVKVFLWPGSFLYIYTLKAAGDTRYPMIASVLSMWICRVLGAYLICNFTSFGLWGVWTGWILDWFLRTVFFVIRFRRGKWMQLKLIKT